MTSQLTLDDMSRGHNRPACRWLHRTPYTGLVGDEGMVVLGNCSLLGGTAYDRRCEICGQWEGKR